MSARDLWARVIDDHAWTYPDSFCECGYYVAEPSAHKWHLADALADAIATEDVAR